MAETTPEQQALKVTSMLYECLDNAGIDIGHTVQFIEGDGVLAIGKIFVEYEEDADDDETMALELVQMGCNEIQTKQTMLRAIQILQNGLSEIEALEEGD